MMRPSSGTRSVSAVAALLVSACAPASTPSTAIRPTGPGLEALRAAAAASAPRPDPRPTLSAGIFDAGEAAWNMRLVSTSPPSGDFVGQVNSDLAFAGNYVIQGSFGGFQVWDISNPAAPTLERAFPCPASQSDVSVYRNLLFVSGEDYGARLDCSAEGIEDRISSARLRGIRIFDISDIRNPGYVGNVQTCRGSHTHTVVENPRDPANVYIYVSGSAPVRSAEELSGCVATQDPNDASSALFRIEVIRVPLANPERAAVVSSPRIFNELVEPATHGAAPAEIEMVERLRAQGVYAFEYFDQVVALNDEFVTHLLDSLVAVRGGGGAPTAADSATLMSALPGIVQKITAGDDTAAGSPRHGPTQCHDITVYSAAGLAGGACEGYGFLLDVRDPINPVRIDAVADQNFSYWHSATFNNDATQLLFSDEWGGGSAPKCRASDPKEWGADAIFSIENRKLVFRGYYKLPAEQSPLENCVAHNGSLLPIPGRDVMVQSWYQGGISVFDWSDPAAPLEIAYFDRGPMDATQPRFGGAWSVYWYNGLIVSSEIGRGLDVLELEASSLLTQNEIDAANTVSLDFLNAQSQPRFQWPATFALARAYLYQIERDRGLANERIASTRDALRAAEAATGSARREALARLASELDGETRRSPGAAKIQMLSETLRRLRDA